jgi:hypothetical protein
MSKVIYGTHEYYAKSRYMGCCAEELRQGTCCICYNTDNYYSCTICRVCNDGIICCPCMQEYDEPNDENDEISTCPICRTLFIHTKIRVLIYGALLKHSVIPVTNTLYRRWIYNYLVSDDYLNMRNFDINDACLHRKYQFKVNRDIRLKLKR